LWALGIFLFAFGIHRGMTMDIFVLGVLAPCNPLGCTRDSKEFFFSGRPEQVADLH
jgi:VanZ family protein